MSSVVNERMSMTHRWNATDRGKANYWEKILPQCHLFHHSFYVYMNKFTFTLPTYITTRDG